MSDRIVVADPNGVLRTPDAVSLMDPETGRSLGSTVNPLPVAPYGVRIATLGVTITTGGTSAYSSIPDTSDGTAPNFVRLACTASCYARMGAPSESSVAMSTTGSGYLIGDQLTVVGGTYSSAMQLAVATSKLVSVVGNVLGSGYDVADVITLAGGTAATKATITLSHLQLATATLNAAGTGYESGQVITTASAGSTASSHATLTVSTTKLISAAVNAHGSGYAAADVLTMVGGTGTGATQTVATMDVASAPTVNAAGTTYIPAQTIDLLVTGSTSSVKAVVTVATTKVVSATVQAGGTGDLGNGAGVIIEGTTGTGTKFRASVTIASNAIASVQSITVGGAYTANPSVLGTEPVTYISGASSGTTLTGAALAVVMGVGTVTLTTPGTYTVGGTVATQNATSGSGTGATFTGVLFGVKTVTLTSAGSYTGASATSFTSTAAPAGGTGATFNTCVFGVNTFAVTTRGDYTVKGTNLSQNGATVPSGGTGFTASTPLWGPLAWTYSQAGDYSATTTALTQDSVAPAGGTGATFQTALYGVKTATVTDPGAYTVDPTNPVATTSTGAGTNAAFNITMVSAAQAGDMLITPYEALIVNAVGFDHVSAIQVTGAGVLVISSIEN